MVSVPDSLISRRGRRRRRPLEIALDTGAVARFTGWRAIVLQDWDSLAWPTEGPAGGQRPALGVGELDVDDELIAVEVRKGPNRAGRGEVAFGGGEGADEVRRGAHRHAGDRGALGDLGR